MIYVTGDTHIPIDIGKLSSKNFPEQKTLSKDDYVIICGDFGGVWNNSSEEKYWLKWLTNKSFTTLFVCGNHENYQMLNRYDISIWNGGKIHRITDSIFHLMRGQVFIINGLKFFTMGGAASHDKIYRIEGKSWWKEEIPSKEEFEEGLDNLQKHNNTVDYIITHCAPESIQHSLAYWYQYDDITKYLEFIKNDCKYKHWFCGHYHVDTDIDKNHTILYNKIVRL